MKREVGKLFINFQSIASAPFTATVSNPTVEQDESLNGYGDGAAAKEADSTSLGPMVIIHENTAPVATTDVNIRGWETICVASLPFLNLIWEFQYEFLKKIYIDRTTWKEKKC